MVGSVAGFLVGYSSPTDNTETFEYKGRTFTRTDQGYLATVNNAQVILVLDPQLVENIPSDPVTILDLNSASKIYLSFNPEENLNQAASYLHTNIRPHLSLPIFPACTSDIERCSDLPIKTCDDATDNEKVMLLQKTEELTSVTYENNCLLIQGKNDLIAPTEKAILQLLGLI